MFMLVTYKGEKPEFLKYVVINLESILSLDFLRINHNLKL